MVSSNSISQISNSRIGTVSGQDKFDALALRGNSAGGAASSEATDKQGKIKAGELLGKKNEKEKDTGDTAKDQAEGDKSKATTGVDSAQQKAVADSTKPNSVFDRISNTPIPDSNTAAAAAPPQTTQPGMDPAMMAAMMGKGSGGGQSTPQQSQQKPSTNSGNEAVKSLKQESQDAIKKLNDKIDRLTKSDKPKEKGSTERGEVNNLKDKSLEKKEMQNFNATEQVKTPIKDDSKDSNGDQLYVINSQSNNELNDYDEENSFNTDASEIT